MQNNFFEEEPVDTDVLNIAEYDITISPRDLTPASIVDMIDNGIMELPIFQRNYVWDIGKASKLVESLILGLPVPELFFYSEGDENSTYKIIDGQQRLLSIYFFLKGRFPKNTQSRVEICKEINSGKDLTTLMADNNLFKDFLLVLNNDNDEVKSRYHAKKFALLDKDTQIKFRLRRYLRTVVIRQNKPENNSSSMFEIFNRLNTGGAALTPQEVRASVYYCPFYNMLTRLNLSDSWRNILNKPSIDLHSNDLEVILRSIALLVDEDNYFPKMTLFLNNFSNKSKNFDREMVDYLENLFDSFISSCSNLGEKAFFRNNRFSKSLFESVFYAVCEDNYLNKRIVKGKINKESFEKLKTDDDFIDSLQSGALSSEGIKRRKERAIALIKLDEE
jgi:hypothetical protein